MKTTGNRRSFLQKTMTGITMAACGVIKPKSLCAAEPGVAKGFSIGGRALQIDNPYERVDWSKSQQIASATHIHIANQEKLDRVCSVFKLKHIPLSNYYPSAPWYPPEKMRQNQYRVSQPWGVVFHSTPGDRATGKFIEGPLDWNKIIMDPKTGWYNELPPEKKSQLPFKVGGPVFTNIPEGLIFSPNAEHHGFTNAPTRATHVNAVGSLFCSGTFDARDEFLLASHGYSSGMGQTWEVGFKNIIDRLLFSDGGGITVNHPVWSGLKSEQVSQLLDFDPRVLGIEVYNDSSGMGNPNRGWSLQVWDEILKTGRSCLGFFTPDHGLGRGKNVLLVPEFNERECLRAYRQGAFFGSVKNETSELRFTNITIENDRLIAETNEKVTLKVYTNKGVESPVGNGNIYEYKLPLRNGQSDINYLRIQAWNSTSDQIFSQPIRFVQK
jgi:hypothetical protein